MRDGSRFAVAALGIVLASLLVWAPAASAGLRTVLIEDFTNTA
jgi:hypothetical protein